MGKYTLYITSKQSKLCFSELDTTASNTNAHEDTDKWSNCNNGDA